MQENREHLVVKPDDEKTSLKELILSIRDWIRYLISKWYIILLFSLIGAVLGFGYALTKKPVYTATTSFVLETGGKSGGMSAYAGIASSLGVDIGGAGGGLFDGENILELYRSRNMITEALLSEANFDGRQQLLIDRYIDFNRLRKSWQKPELKNIRFKLDNKYDDIKLQLLHDSITGQIVKRINATNLKVEKKDKKLNLIYVTVNCADELFAKIFNEHLVQKVNQFYLDTKSRKNIENVAILQAKTDSVRATMAGSINRAAVVADATPNQNPTRMTQRIAPIQNARVSAEINQEVLGSLLQNLELSKIALSKETPLIQIVDEPILPLDKIMFGKLKGIVIGGFMAGVLIILVLTIIQFIKRTLA